MRARRHEGVPLQASALWAQCLCLCLGGGPARAEEAGERPLLQLDGSQPTAEEGTGTEWRASTAIGKRPARGDKARPQERPQAPAAGTKPTDDALLPPGFVPAKPVLKMSYHGVAPGSAELPPKSPKLPLGKGPQRLTWPGFQMKDGRPTLFLQLSGPIEYSISEKPGAVLVTLHDTVVTLRNNLRPLLVQDFNTAVKQVRFERKKKTVTAVVSVKGSVAHTEKMETAENGFQMLLVQFSPMPAGGAEPAGPSPEPPKGGPSAKAP